MSSPKDKHIVMDLLLKSLSIVLPTPRTLRLDWQRGSNKVSTHEFMTKVGQTSIELNERFQIQTCIFYDDKLQKYEQKPSQLVVADVLGNILGKAELDISEYASSLESEEYAKDINNKLRLQLSLSLQNCDIDPTPWIEVYLTLGYQKVQPLDAQQAAKAEEVQKKQLKMLEQNFQKQKSQKEQQVQTLKQEVQFAEFTRKREVEVYDKKVEELDIKMKDLVIKEETLTDEIAQAELDLQTINKQYDESMARHSQGNTNTELADKDALIKAKSDDLERMQEQVDQTTHENKRLRAEILKIKDDIEQEDKQFQKEQEFAKKDEERAKADTHKEEYEKVLKQYEDVKLQEQKRYVMDRYDEFE